MKNVLATYFKSTTSAAPLAFFRISFGVLMLLSIIRFWYMGWIDKLYIQPNFFFSYYGFEWVQPIGEWTYLLFIVAAIFSILITIGYWYRLAIIGFFLSFTYIELMDKTTYLNHYYFISLLSFLFIFLPANAYFSADAANSKETRKQFIYSWQIDIIKLFVGMVYMFAGIAKLNYDWLFNAMPLKIWLPSKFDLPILGSLLEQNWVHYLFSWSGALYDLFIPFLLLYKPTRNLAFLAVVVFHLLTRYLFPIGMFPYIMIVSALIFFEPHVHQRILGFIAKIFKFRSASFDNGLSWGYTSVLKKKITNSILILFLVWHFLIPFRYILYPGNLFWTEEGFRFSWRVMLVEKVGYASFKIVDGKTGKSFLVRNGDFLTSFQEKQMAFQADFILEYGKYLGEHFASQGHQNVEVYVDCHVAMNGESNKRFIDPNVDLMKLNESFKHKSWILPYE